MPYHRFLSLSPTLHQVCSSDFVGELWISIMMSITFQSISTDWRNQAGPQFQLLSNLCNLANKTIDDAIRRFITQSFVTLNVLNEFDFQTQLNATLQQFIQSTTTYFVQIIDVVDVLMQVDQPLTQLGSANSRATNIHADIFTEEYDSWYELSHIEVCCHWEIISIFFEFTDSVLDFSRRQWYIFSSVGCQSLRQLFSYLLNRNKH